VNTIQMAEEMLVLQGKDGRASTCEFRNLEWLVPICYTNCSSSLYFCKNLCFVRSL